MYKPHFSPDFHLERTTSLTFFSGSLGQIFDMKADIHLGPGIHLIIQQRIGQRVTFQPCVRDKQCAMFFVDGQCHVRKSDVCAAAVKNCGDTQGDQAGKVDRLTKKIPVLGE